MAKVDYNSEQYMALGPYRWLGWSPLLTIPTLIFASFSFYDSPFVAVLLSALWHLLLLQYTSKTQSTFVRWHGRQAFLLAGIRTLIALLFSYTSFPFYALLILTYFIGNAWGRGQVKRGECWLMTANGVNDGLPIPTTIHEEPRPNTSSKEPAMNSAQNSDLDTILTDLRSRDEARQLAAIATLGTVRYSSEAIVLELEKLALGKSTKVGHAALEALSLQTSQFVTSKRNSLVRSMREAILHQISMWAEDGLLEPHRATVIKRRYDFDIRVGTAARQAVPSAEPHVEKPSAPSQAPLAQPAPLKVEPRPVVVAPVKAAVVSKPVARPKPVAPPKPVRPPVDWRKLIGDAAASGALLRGLLYLGAFILIVSATVLVVGFWGEFNQALQLIFIASVPLIFYIGGWFLQTRLKLTQTGSVLTGVGAVFVAIDFAAIYQFGGLAGQVNGPLYGTFVAIICTAIYAFTASRMHSEFFDYLTLVAGTGVVFTVTNLLGSSFAWKAQLEWDFVSICASSAAMVWASGRFGKLKGTFGDLARAARYLPQVLLPLSLFFLLLSPARPAVPHMVGLLFATLAYSALAWYFPALVFAYTALVASIGTVAFGLGVADLPLEWYASVAAILALVYLVLGQRLQRASSDLPVIKNYVKALNTTALVLITLSVLSGTFFRTAEFWPGVIALTLASINLALCAYFFNDSTFTLLAAGLFIAPFTLIAGRWISNAQPASTLHWVIAADEALALAYLGLAIAIRNSKEHARALHVWAHVLIPIALLVLAGISVPPFAPSLIALGLALAAYVTSFILHDSGQHPALVGLSDKLPFGLGKSIFLWPIALLIPIFAATAWSGARLSPEWLGALIAAFGLAYVGAGQRLFQRAKEYRLPFHVFTYLLSIIGLFSAGPNDDALLASLLIIVASLATLAYLYNRVVETILASLLFLWPFQIILDRLKIPENMQSLAYTLLGSLVYISIAVYLNKFLKSREKFHPAILFVLGYTLVIAKTLMSIIDSAAEPSYLPWVGVTIPLVASALFIFSAWYFKVSTYAFAWAWATTLTFTIAFAQSLTLFKVPPAFGALAWAGLATSYMLIERSLNFFASGKNDESKKFWATLFHAPLVLFIIGLSVLALLLSAPATLRAFSGLPLTDYLPPLLAQSLIVILTIAFARLYQQRWPLFFEPFISFLPVTLFFIGFGERIFGATLSTPQYALAWAGLAVIHISVAAFIDRLAVRYANGIYLGGYILLGWAVAWTLNENSILVWTLGLWILASVASALLVHFSKHQSWAEFVQLLSGKTEGPNRTFLRNVFIWSAAWLFPIWCVILLRAINVTDDFSWLGLVSAPLAYLGLILWLNKVDSSYTRPVYSAAQFFTALSLFISAPISLKYLSGDYVIPKGTPGLLAFVILQTVAVVFYSASAWMRGSRSFAHVASWLSFIPYTLAWIVYDPTLASFDFALRWLGLTSVLLVIGLVLDNYKVRYAHGPYLTAYVLAVLALTVSTADRVTNIYTLLVTILLAILSYLLVHFGRHHSFEDFIAAFWSKADSTSQQIVSTIFLFFATFAFPVLTMQVMAHNDFSVALRGATLALIAPLYIAIALLVGRSKPRGTLSPVPTWALYSAGYTLTAVGAMVAFEDLRVATYVLALNAIVYAASAYIFKQTFWLYLSNVLAPVIAFLILQQTDHLNADWIAPTFMAFAFVYFGIGQLFDRAQKTDSLEIHPFAAPFYAPGFVLSAIALAVASGDKNLAIQIYSAGVILYALAGWLFREALFIYPASWLAAVPYFLAITLTPLETKWYGLAWLPLIVLYIGLGRFVFHRKALPSLGQGLLAQWLSHPAVPFYILAYGLSLSMISLSYINPLSITIAFGAGAVIYFASAYLFRTPGWIYAGLFTSHMSILVSFTINPQGGSAHHLAYPFHAMIWLTALIGYAFSRSTAESAPRSAKDAYGSALLEHLLGHAWARPFFVFTFIEMILWQTVALYGYDTTIVLASGHALLLTLFAILWTEGALVYGVVGFGLLAVGATLKREQVPFADALAIFSGIGFGLYLLGQILKSASSRMKALVVWPGPLTQSAIFLTAVAATLNLTQFAAHLTALAISLAFAGALYVTIAYRARLYALGYLGMALLQVAWIFILYTNEIIQPQLYAIPGGLYFLAVAYLELQRNRKQYALPIEIFGLAILLVTTFAQSLSATQGLVYFILLIIEGFLVIWWGTIQKRRIPFFSGIGAIAFNFVAQVILLVDRGIVSIWYVGFGVGLLIMGAAIYIERGREQLRARSREWSETLEKWE